MIKRYSTEIMNKLWSDSNKFETYLQVEIASLKAWAKLGNVPKSDVEQIIKKSKINLELITQLEKELKHDVIAFTRSITNTLGKEGKWFHYGLTSTDVVDTAYGVIYKDVNKHILASLNAFLEVLKNKALKYKNTPCIGRTHGVHADITSFGLKWALYYEEMKRNIERFKIASNQIEVGKISGAVGNFANTDLRLQDLVCQELKITSTNISTQTLQRDRHAFYISTIAIIGSTIEKIATEIRHLQRTEVREVEEYFSKNQKGSSAMPHKRNPITSENMTGCARVLRGYVTPMMESNALWHERDLSHSSVERIIIPDATTLIHYMLIRFAKTVDNLNVFENKMLENINKTNGLIFSQQILKALINKNVTRDEGYDVIQKLAMESWTNNTDFKSSILKDNFITSKLSAKEIEATFDYKYFLRNVDGIYKKIFK